LQFLSTTLTRVYNLEYNIVMSDTNFDPDAVAQNNGNFAGLPYEFETSKLILLSVPWEVTVSYNAGTARADAVIRNASMQLDLYDPLFQDNYKKGIFWLPLDQEVLNASDKNREFAKQYIDYLAGDSELTDKEAKAILSKVNKASELLNENTYNKTRSILNKNQKIGLIGGDHSVPLGYYKALGEKHPDGFGILHLDAHHDLRDAYEDFKDSHASIFFNALRDVPSITKLVQVGIRDFGEQEAIMAREDPRIEVYYDTVIKQCVFEGLKFSTVVDDIISKLPDKVYISFDIDGLEPSFCSTTGTPVPGGLSYDQVIYLFGKLHQSGKEIIGFDMVEVGSDSELDANIAMRLIYKMCNLCLK
jgi:agmatinase